MSFPYQILYDPREFMKLSSSIPLRKRAIAHQSLSRMWHRLYDDCGHLQEALADNSSNLLNEFLSWIIDNGHTIDWRFSTWFIVWLRITENDTLLTDKKIVEELILKSLRLWCLTDYSEAKFIVFHCKFAKINTYLVQKQTHFDKAPQIHEVVLAHTPNENIKYYLLKDINEIHNAEGFEIITEFEAKKTRPEL